MSLNNIVTLIREFSAGDTYNLDLAGGRIFIHDESFGEDVRSFLDSDDAKSRPAISKSLSQIVSLNSQIQVEDLDDPEPLEDELLTRCKEFLWLFNG